MEKRIAIQGLEGSFHHKAAVAFFGKEITIVPCLTFRNLINEASINPTIPFAIMAIENTIAGSILPNYQLLRKSKLKIIGELKLKIRQHLLVNAEVEIDQIKEVHSHPMALLQCMDYLEQKPWKLVETEDTALSAKYIAQHKAKHIAAIAGSIAAEMYHLKIAVPDIQTEKNNATRFLILSKKTVSTSIEIANKATLYFQVTHEKGSLAKVLHCIAVEHLNVSKLQSIPIPGSNFKYGFFIDVEFENIQHFNSCILKLKGKANNLEVLGIYCKSIKSLQS